MDEELDLLLGTVIDDLTKLMLVLDLHGVPGSARSAAELAAKVQRPPEPIERALSELAEAGLVERFALGTGRLSMYGPSDDEHVREVLDLLHARYHGSPRSRAEIVHRILKLGARQREDEQE